MPSLVHRIKAPVCVAVLALLGAGCGANSAHSPSARTMPLQTMFEAQSQLLADPTGTIEMLRRLGVDQVRVFVPWSSLAPDVSAPALPAGIDPTSTNAYSTANWEPYDAIVRAAAARGMSVAMTLEGGAPRWAEAPGQPGGPPGVWKPSARYYGTFVRSVSARYSGTYKLVGSPSALPRVSVWSIWNEPNYGQQLAPQAIDNSTVDVSPAMYRRLVGAAWTALHQTGHGSDTILIGELAPRGITTGNNPDNFSGMVPLRFVRALYCVDGSFKPLRGNAAGERGCPTTADASESFAEANPGLFQASGFAVHPYPQGRVPPNVPTTDEPDYADLPALPNLERALDRAQSAYGQDRHMDIYDTEFGYQTNPPETIPRAINPTLAAEYLNWGEYLHWRDPRVATFNQYLLSDPPGGNFATGLEFANGAPKGPLYDAFRLPIFLPATSAKRRQQFELWGCIRPARYARLDTGVSQAAQIQFRAAGSTSFQTLKSLPVTDPDGYLLTRLAFPGSGAVRLAWSYPRGPTIYSRTVAVTVS